MISAWILSTSFGCHKDFLAEQIAVSDTFSVTRVTQYSLLIVGKAQRYGDIVSTMSTDQQQL